MSTDQANTSADVEVIEYEHAKLEFDGRLAIFSLNDPDKLNALRPDMVEAIYAAIIEIQKPRRKVRCLMITGEGRGFCSGANLSGESTRERKRAEPPVIETVEGTFHPLLRRLRDLEIPVVTAVNGPCVGFGLALTLIADYVIASDKAFFLVPFASIASAPDSGLTWLLSNAVGLPRARQMVMRAERVYADKAYDWGMINQVVPNDEFRAEARKMAQEYAAGPTVALGVIRQLFQRVPELTLDALLEKECRGVAKTCRTKDNSIAIRSFGSKEKANFIGE